LILGVHGDCAGLGEGVGADGFPAGFAGDVGFFEEAGAVVFDDSVD